MGGKGKLAKDCYFIPFCYRNSLALSFCNKKFCPGYHKTVDVEEIPEMVSFDQYFNLHYYNSHFSKYNCVKAYYCILFLLLTHDLLCPSCLTEIRSLGLYLSCFLPEAKKTGHHALILSSLLSSVIY